MNIDQIQIRLQESIAQATATVDYLLLARALESLNLGQIRTVAAYANLPAAAGNEGLLVWVTADERLYWSSGTAWYVIYAEQPTAIWAWGGNACGRLGDGTTVNKSSPVSVVGGFTDWCQVSVGCRHSIGIRTNGTAWAWGSGAFGRLGDNTITNKSSPVSVVGGFTDWCQVSAGGFHSFGLRTNGTLWAWGTNSCGILGDNTSVSKTSPVSVVGGFTWCRISAGYIHSLAIKNDGTAWAWGNGSVGRLGDGTTVSKSSPVSVVGGFTWCQVAAGGSHSLAIRNNGTAWSWGCNGQGRLGDSTTANKSSPVSVVGGFTDWCQVSAGLTHSLGLRTNGTAWAWGCNAAGILGDGTTVDKNSPVAVVGGFIDWCQVAAGGYHSLGARINGTVWSWGCNSGYFGGAGMLGDGTTVNKSSPVSVVGGFTDWCSIDANTGGSLSLRNLNF